MSTIKSLHSRKMLVKSIFIGQAIPPNPIPFDVERISRPKRVIPFANIGTKLLACTNGALDTWQDHFQVHSWGTIQDQINAGFPYFANPAWPPENVPSGDYQEVFDVGTVLNNSIVSVNVSRESIYQEVDLVIKISTSETGTLGPPATGFVWTEWSEGSSEFYQAFRFIRIRLEFHHETAASLAVFTNFTVSVSVKEEIDSGSILANSSDAKPGTLVYFKKVFKDINSLTATTESTTQPYNVILSWVDEPNPTFFHVMVFDSAGNRVTKQISWKARGVV